MARRAARAALAALALAACDRDATLALTLQYPFGESSLPDGTTRVRATVDGEATTAESPVGADGRFVLDLALPASGRAARVHVDALDDLGVVLATGATPPLPLSGVDDTLTVFVSPPGGAARLPTGFRAARSQVAAAALPYGVLYAGGADAIGMPTTEVLVYNAYQHAFQVGEDLPAPLSDACTVARADGVVYFFGGLGVAGAPSGALRAFDTNVAPAGRHVELADFPELARSGAACALRGDGRLVVAGFPVLVIDLDTAAVTTLAVSISERSRATRRADGSVVLSGENTAFLVAAEGTGVAPVAGLDKLGAHDAVLLPDGRVLFAGGGVTQVTLLGPDDTLEAPLPLLDEERLAPTLALVDGTLVVLGGELFAGASGIIELFDAETLEPRGKAFAPFGPGLAVRTHRLASGTLLVHANGEAALYLFQPPRTIP